MTLEQIETWARRLSELGLAELSVTEAEGRLTLRRAVGPAAAPVAEAPALPSIRAPFFGHLRLCHPQRAEPEATPGAALEPGQILAYVEAGGQLHPVAATDAGHLGDWLVEDGALVGYGAALARVTP